MNYTIILVFLIVVIYLISQKEDFGADAAEQVPKYGKGLCSEVYQPNRNNYNGGTDCGREDGVFEDWRNNGGSCPDYQREDSRCGKGCRWAGGRCV